ncbi:MAG TPA: hypothetical protein VMH48_05100 [Methylomirabilota bacterium]|nr:hypothetical protein [Methylomirabilota bacterium]
MAKNRKTILVISVAVAIGIGVIGTWSHAKRRNRLLYRQTVEGLKNDVDRVLPLGSPKAAVLKFLDAHAIQYFDFDPKTAFGEGTVINDPWYSGASQSVKGGTSWIGDCRIEVEFKFDKSEKLLGYRERPACKVSLF